MRFRKKQLLKKQMQESYTDLNFWGAFGSYTKYQLDRQDEKFIHLPFKIVTQGRELNAFERGVGNRIATFICY